MYDDADILRLVWLHAEGHNSSGQMGLFEATLYGSTSIVDFSEKMSLGTCFYFQNSDFYRYRKNLDGAIVSAGTEVKILLNTYSPRYERLRDSLLVSRFKDGVCDPVKIESEGRGYIMDGDVDRSNKEAVLEYLRQKYHQEKLKDMTMNNLSVHMAIPSEINT